MATFDRDKYIDYFLPYNKGLDTVQTVNQNKNNICYLNDKIENKLTDINDEIDKKLLDQDKKVENQLKEQNDKVENQLKEQNTNVDKKIGDALTESEIEISNKINELEKSFSGFKIKKINWGDKIFSNKIYFIEGDITLKNISGSGTDNIYFSVIPIIYGNLDKTLFFSIPTGIVLYNFIYASDYNQWKIMNNNNIEYNILKNNLNIFELSNKGLE